MFESLCPDAPAALAVLGGKNMPPNPLATLVAGVRGASIAFEFCLSLSPLSLSIPSLPE
jgi:hypothetical protein